MTIGRQNALVVDDEPTIRDTLSRLLGIANFETATAENGYEALAHAQSQEFAIVLLDIGMPGLSGMEVLEQLVAKYPDTGVIMVTAVSDAKTAVEAMKLGAYDYVIKPFDLDDVLIRVQKALERRTLTLRVKNYQQDLEQKLLEREQELRATTNQLVKAIIKEETLLDRARSPEKKQNGQRTQVDLKQFGAKIIRRLQGSGS